MKTPAIWSVYIIHCTDNSLYTGITRDIDRRFRQHSNRHGAKYFRARQPQALVYLETGHSRSTASQRENAIKKLSRSEKLQLIALATNNQPTLTNGMACTTTLTEIEFDEL